MREISFRSAAWYHGGMRRSSILILIVLGVLALFGLLVYAFVSGGADVDVVAPPEGTVSSTQEQYVRESIDDANYCATAADCRMVGSVCPFGCYIHAHADEAARIGAMLEAYPSTCMYSCIEYPGVACVGGKCELRPAR